MAPRRFRSCHHVFALALIAAVAAGGGPASAQKPPPPGKPNPAAPVLAPVVPLGIQRGTALELTLTGSNLAEPTGLLLSFPAKVTFAKGSKDAAKLKVRLEVPADAPLGYHSVRLATTRGMSNLRLFCIDDLPQVLEKDTNRSKTTPQELPLPCVVVGKVDAEVSDWYRVTVKPGQRLSFEVLGRRLGSDLDPQLSLYNMKSGREVAHDNDAPGCQSDPRLTFTFKEGGDYLVEVKDVLNRGGADFWYRMRVGDFPAATAPVPMAIQRGTKAKVGFAGPAVEGVTPVEVAAPADPLATTLWVAPKGASGLHGWPVALAVSDHEERVEKEPNNEPGQANRVPVPGGITGRFEQSADTDWYVFAAKKGQKLQIEAQTLELYSPTLVYFVVRNAKTKAEVAKSNPQAAPPLDQRIDFTAPEDGDYLVEVQHLNYQGGQAEAYRLTVTPSVPGFDLTLALERYDAAAGGTLALPVLVNRRGHAGPIEVTVVGPPGISGQVTIPAGQPAKPNTPGATLTVKVSPDVAPGPYRLTLLGKATIDGKEVVQALSVKTPVSQSLANLPYPPRQLLEEVALAVRPAEPVKAAGSFTLKAEPTTLAVEAGKKATLKVTTIRKGYDGPITLEVRNLPAKVTAGKATIAAGQTSAVVELMAAADAPAAGRADVVVAGTGTGNVQAVAPNVNVKVGK